MTRLKGAFKHQDRYFIIPSVKIENERYLKCNIHEFAQVIKPHQFRIYHTKKGAWINLWDPETNEIIYVSMQLVFNTLYFEGIPLRPTGVKDAAGQDLYEKDVCIHQGRKFIIVFRDGAYWAVWFEDEAEELLCMVADESIYCKSYYQDPRTKLSSNLLTQIL